MKAQRKKFSAVILALLLFVTSMSILSCLGEGNENDVADITEAETTSKETEVPDDTAEVTEKETETAEATEEQTKAPETEAEVTAEETEQETVPVTEAPVETAPPAPNYVGVTGITLTTYEVSLEAGDRQMPIVTMHPWNCTDKGEIWTSSDTSVATVDIYGNITGVSKGSCTVTVTSTDNSAVFATVKVTVTSGVLPTYIDGILIVNKTYALPKSYAPGWDAEASSQIWAMFAAAKNEGIILRVQSGYRSYVDQRIIYNNYVAVDGQAAADRYSARPGHSEHQSGLAFDLNTTYYNGLTQEFGNTPEGKWLAENCYKYGFIIRYPQDKEHITGYMYEPWHVRYLGVEKATLVYESGLCLEEYLGITSSYS